MKPLSKREKQKQIKKKKIQITALPLLEMTPLEVAEVSIFERCPTWLRAKMTELH